jgi:hypothetical protein
MEEIILLVPGASKNSRQVASSYKGDNLVDAMSKFFISDDIEDFTAYP